jgi:hypothetical protein
VGIAPIIQLAIARFFPYVPLRFIRLYASEARIIVGIPEKGPRQKLLIPRIKLATANLSAFDLLISPLKKKKAGTGKSVPAA